jgi:hypothetical protein
MMVQIGQESKSDFGKSFNPNILGLLMDKEANGTAIASRELPLAGRAPDNPADSTMRSTYRM